MLNNNWGFEFECYLIRLHVSDNAQALLFCFVAIWFVPWQYKIEPLVSSIL